MVEAKVPSPGRSRGMGEIIEIEGKKTEMSPFGHTLTALARERPEIVALTADMARYSDLVPFREAHPDRFFNVGVAEQSLIMTAAGLSKTGKIAYCTTYSVFISRRAYDFVSIAGAHAMANIKIFAGMPGLMNSYGATHQATEDLNLMRGIADLTVIDPCDATELKQIVHAVADIPGTCYVRLLRGKVAVELDDHYKFELGKAKLIHPGRDVGIIGTGYMSARGRDAATIAESEYGVSTGVLHVGTIKPFDTKGVVEFAQRYDRLIVAENHKTTGGLATLVIEALFEAGIVKPIIKIGLADSFFECGSQDYLEAKYGVDLPRFVRAIVQNT
jgi:transketolase